MHRIWLTDGINNQHKYNVGLQKKLRIISTEQGLQIEIQNQSISFDKVGTQIRIELLVHHRFTNQIQNHHCLQSKYIQCTTNRFRIIGAELIKLTAQI